MDRVLDGHAALLELIRQLLHVVLRSGDGHAIARHEHDEAGECEQRRDVLNRGRVHRTAFLTGGSRRRHGGAEPAEQHVEERPVHRTAHRDGEDRSRRPDERPAHDENVVAEHEPRGRCGQTGERVEQRDDHGHVGAADGDHEQGAQCEREDEEHDEERSAGRRDARDPQRQDRQEHGGVDLSLVRVDERPPGEQLLQLAERDQTSGEAQRSDEAAEHDGPRDVRCCSVSGERGAKVLRRDERGAPSPHAVEQGHHLRHRRHAHQARRANAERPADHERRDDERPVAGAGDQPEGDTEYEKHADRGDAVPTQRRRRRAKQLDTDHEAEGGTGVAENREARGHQAPGSAPVVGATGSAALLRVSAGLRLNISSMRSVTTHPPTTFSVPSNTAMIEMA